MNRLFRAQITAPDKPASSSVRWIVASSLSDAMVELEATLPPCTPYEIEDGIALFHNCIEIDEQELESKLVCSSYLHACRFENRTLFEALNILASE